MIACLRRDYFHVASRTECLGSKFGDYARAFGLGAVEWTLALNLKTIIKENEFPANPYENPVRTIGSITFEYKKRFNKQPS